MNRVEPYTKNKEPAEDTEVLEKDIQSTRERMDKTIDSLSSKLNPERYIESAGDWMKERIDSVDTDSMKRSAKRVGRKTGNIVRDHPLPVAFGALTIASMFFKRPTYDREIREPYIPAHPEATGPTGKINPTLEPGVKQLPENSENTESGESSNGRISGAAQSVKESLSNAAHKTGDALRNLGSSTRETASHGAEISGRAVRRGNQKYPAAVALGALVVGFLAAMSLPGTRRENETVGDKSDEVKDRLSRRGHEMVDETKESLRDKKDELVENAREKKDEFIGNAKEKTQSKIDEVATKVETEIDERVEPS